VTVQVFALLIGSHEIIVEGKYRRRRRRRCCCRSINK